MGATVAKFSTSLAKMPRLVSHLADDPKLKRFDELRRNRRGMLGTEVYFTLHKLMSESSAVGDCVEMGAGGGAGTVALAWALIEMQAMGNVICVDRCFYGSRVRFGGFTENASYLCETLKLYGVEARVTHLPITLTCRNFKSVIDCVRTPTISALVCDADGEVGRDICGLSDQITSNTVIMIDDFVDYPMYRAISPEYPFGGTKCVLTFRIVDWLVSSGYVVVQRQIGKTVFLSRRFSAIDVPAIRRRVQAIRASVWADWKRAIQNAVTTRGESNV